MFGCGLDAPSLLASGGPPNLKVREIDAAASFAEFRQRYSGLVEDAFERVGGGPDAVVAMQQIMDLAPPGIDEVMAIADVADLVVEDRDDAPRRS